MKDILLKRNDLKNKSVHLRNMRFEPNVKYEQTETIAKEQNKLYKQWKFYDRFIKAREEVKSEIKSSNMGKEE